MTFKYISRCFLVINSLVFSTHLHAATAFDFTDGLITGVTGLETTEGVWDVTINDIDISEATVQADEATAMILSDVLASSIQTSIYTGDPGAFYGCDDIPICILMTVTSVEVLSGTSTALEGWSVLIGEPVPDGAISGGPSTGGGGGNPSGWSFLTWERVSEVPIPATIWLFGTGLIGLIGLARRKSFVSI